MQCRYPMSIFVWFDYEIFGMSTPCGIWCYLNQIGIYLTVSQRGGANDKFRHHLMSNLPHVSGRNVCVCVCWGGGGGCLISTCTLYYCLLVLLTSLLGTLGNQEPRLQGTVTVFTRLSPAGLNYFLYFLVRAYSGVGLIWGQGLFRARAFALQMRW